MMTEPPEGPARRALQNLRDMAMRRRVDLIAGRDLVKLTLSTPTPIEILRSSRLRDVVLDRACYYRDEEAMIRRVTNDQALTRDALISDAANPENGHFPALTDAWKLLICDVRLLEGVALQHAYDAQLQEEKLQTPVERAKEIVRTEDEKVARRNARWFIPALERILSEQSAQVDLQRDDGPQHESITLTLWKQLSPAPPAWIQKIVDTRQPWGYVFYKTSELDRKYGHGWAAIWQTICEKTQLVPYDGSDERSAEYACLEKIHCKGDRLLIRDLWTEDWPAGPTTGDSVADHAVREHFRSHRESFLSPGILHNTFIVIDAEPIPETLPYALANFWVWAYDADWEPSLTLHEDEYQGRVKVSIYSLDAWFYAARSEGVSLRDMWLRAQSHPEKQWICLSKPLEEWHHESYI